VLLPNSSAKYEKNGVRIIFGGWVGLVSSGASEDAERAGLTRYLKSRSERGTAGERNFATLGQNERPRENTDQASRE